MNLMTTMEVMIPLEKKTIEKRAEGPEKLSKVVKDVPAYKGPRDPEHRLKALRLWRSLGMRGPFLQQ